MSGTVRFETGPRVRIPSPGGLARRRRVVGAGKRLLPMGALALLGLLVLWPEVQRQVDPARSVLPRGSFDAASGDLREAVYHGADERGRPFTITADLARQSGAGQAQRVALTAPKADMVGDGGKWLMVQAARGDYAPASSGLDLSGDVTLYREDGTTLQTSAATLDLKAGAASSSERVHVEGPFGTVDAQGFFLADGGASLRFSGPARLVLR